MSPSRKIWLPPTIAAIVGIAAALIFLTTHTPAMGALLVVGLYLALMTFCWPTLGIIFLVVLMLFSPEVGVGSTGGRPVTLRGDDVLVVLIAMGWFAQIARRKSRPLLRRTPLNVPLFALVAAIVISTLWNMTNGNVAPLTGLMYAGKRLEYILVFFMVASVFKDWEHARSVLWLFLAGCFIVTILGLLQYLRPGGTGVTASFGPGEANTLGGFALLMFCVSLGLSTQMEKDLWRYAMVGLTAMAAICLILTYSRGAYVAFPFGVVALVLVDRSGRCLKHFLWFALPGVGLLAVLLSIGYVTNYEPLASKAQVIIKNLSSIWAVLTQGPYADPSMKARWKAWKIAIDTFMHSPLIGAGVGSRPMGYYDSHWFRELAETGLAGLLAFAWVQISAVKMALKVKGRAQGLPHGLAVGMIGAQVAMWVHGLSVENFYTIRTAEPFFFLAGLLALAYVGLETQPAPAREQEEETAPETTPARPAEDFA